MTAKYIVASLLTALRMFGIFTPRYIDFVNCTCMMTNAKTATSKGTDG